MLWSNFGILDISRWLYTEFLTRNPKFSSNIARFYSQEGKHRKNEFKNKTKKNPYSFFIPLNKGSNLSVYCIRVGNFSSVYRTNCSWIPLGATRAPSRRSGSWCLDRTTRLRCILQCSTRHLGAALARFFCFLVFFSTGFLRFLSFFHPIFS